MCIRDRDKSVQEPPLALSGAADNWDFRADDSDYYTQAGDLFRLMSAEQKQTLFDNTARAMQGTTKEVQQRHVKNCEQADKAYGAGVAKALGL